jgi:hypothetical protein
MLKHLLAVNDCLSALRGTAIMDAKTCQLEVRAANRVYRLTPQFINQVDGRFTYSPTLSSKSIGFIGWLPYFNKRWSEAIDKRAFKATCASLGLKLPSTGQLALEHRDGVLVKGAKESFGRQIRGPFKRSERKPALKAGEFYEAFMPGKIAKTWFWNEEPIALEIEEMPSVIGDGSTPLRAQVLSSASRESAPVNWLSVEHCLAWQDLSLDDVLAPERKAMIDFRYGSRLAKGTPISGQLHAMRQSSVVAQLYAAGPRFFHLIPQSIREGTLYSVDAMIDEQDVVWFLEMNCNPAVHTDVYPAIFRTLFDVTNAGHREKGAAPSGERPSPSSTSPASNAPACPAEVAGTPVFRAWN